MDVGEYGEMALASEAVELGLFVRRLRVHEPGLVRHVMWLMGFRVGDVLVLWDKHIGHLAEVLKGIPRKGWMDTNAAWWTRGVIVRDALVRANGGAALLEKGKERDKTRHGDVLLRFVESMVLPLGRVRLHARSREDPEWQPGERDRALEKRLRFYRPLLRNIYPVDLGLEKELRKGEGGEGRMERWTERTCHRCAHQGFGMTTALVSAVPGGRGTLRILYALLKGVDPADRAAYRAAMKEFDGMLTLCKKVDRVDDPRERAGGVPPGPGWLWDAVERNRGHRRLLCCPAWQYMTVVREVPGRVGSTVMAVGMALCLEPRKVDEPGIYGADDVGTVYLPYLLQRNAQHKPMTWDEWDAKRDRE